MQHVTRCSGVAATMAICSSPASQAPVLKVADAMILENLVFTGPCLLDKLLGGYACLLMSLRARFHDAMTAEKLILDMRGDGGYLEAHTRRSKTSNTTARKRRFLPMVGPAKLFADKPWGVEWMALRKEAGLEVGKDIPLMPAPACSGGWCKRPLSVGEFNDWINNVLPLYLNVDGKVRSRSSHGLKAMGFSWAAKYGVLADYRRLLGYHTNPSESSLLTYGHYHMAAQVRAVDRVILAIKEHNFMHDESRAGMIAAD